MKLNFKNEGGEIILTINILGKEDGEGWLKAMVHFDDKGFSARFKISLMLNDLYAFANQLKPFQKSLAGNVQFSSIEDNVNLVLSTDGIGHISISGMLRHTHDWDLKTLFVINSDQTFLPGLITECNEILEHYQPQ